MAKTKKIQADKPDKLYPIFVLSGEDRRRMIDISHYITDMVTGEDDPQLVVSTHDGEKAAFPEVIDDLQTMPFLSQYRLVIITDADKFVSAYRDKLETYLEKPSATGILMLHMKSFPGNTRLAKKSDKIGWVCKFEELTEKELPKFVADYAKKEHKLKIQPSIAELLIELVGNSSGQLINEIDKLAAFLIGSGKTEITEDEIEKLVGNNRQYDAFNVIDAISQQNTPLALNLLDQMLAKNKDAEFSAVGAFAWYFRKLYKARVMYSQKMPPFEITRAAGVWHNKESFMKLVSVMNGGKIANAIQRLTEIDYATKSGGGTIKFGLEKFIVEFCK